MDREKQVGPMDDLHHSKTYDFFYKADNFDPVFNEKLEFDLDIDVQDALRAALKEFNKLIK
jgi:hypothetical protein